MSLIQAESQSDALIAVAIGLGAMRLTDTAEEVLRAVELNPPKVLKGVFSLAVVAVGVSYSATGGLRRRLLVGAAAAGVASLSHAVERMWRYRADESASAVLRGAARSY